MEAKSFQVGKNELLRGALSVLAVAGLLLIARNNYLLFHSLAELYTVGIAGSMFVVSWHSKDLVERSDFLFLGIAYFFCGIMDLFHTLSYSGMMIFPERTANLPTCLWVAARFLESVSWLFFLRITGRRINADLLFFICFLIVIPITGTILYRDHLLPACYIEGVGLTSFKIVSEYLICGVFVVALALLYRKRTHFKPEVYGFLSASLLMTIFSEISFTMYSSVTALPNIIGHLFKIVSFYLVYKAVVGIGLKGVFFRVKTESEEREYRYRQLFEKTGAVKVVVEPATGRIVAANRAASDFYGYSEAMLKEMMITDIDTLPARSLLAIMNNPKLRNMKSMHFLHRLANRELRNVEVFSAPVRYENKVLLYAIIHDITRQKKAEEAARNSERLAEALLAGSGEAVFLLDHRNRIQCFNDVASELMGKEDLYGELFFDLISSWKKNELEEQISLSFNERELVEVVVFSGDKWFGVRCHPAIEGVVLFIKDITTEKQLERRVLQAQKIETFGAFIGGILHDFNNHLSSIIGFAEVALESAEAGSELESDLNEILEAGFSSMEAVDQMNHFTRYRGDEVIAIRVDRILKEVVRFIESSAQLKVDFKKEILSNAAVMANPSLLHQLIMTLLMGAVNRQGGAEGEIGISLKEVFLDEVDVEVTTDIQKGRYLFLSVSWPGEVKEIDGKDIRIAEDVVSSFGGTLTVETDTGNNDRINVYLPVVADQAGADFRQGTDRADGVKRSILVVDDELQIVKLMKTILTNNGYLVTGVTDSIEALSLFRKSPEDFNLVISDMTMPEMAGDELIQSIRTVREDVPVILCTGYSKRLPPDPVTTLQIQKVLVKPIIKNDLLEAVRELMDDRATLDDKGGV